VYTMANSMSAGSFYKGVSSPEPVTIGIPGQDNITGGGHLQAANPAGIYADATTKKVNFGFAMKYIKSGKNLMGQANIVFRGAGGVSYQIKSNAINSLTVSDVKQVTAVIGRKAVFTTKANLTKTEVASDGTVTTTSLAAI
ncbi:MAG: hypothetical protein ICV66_08050, partial [Chitinophagaceae bacterium]|nr:hypothetical protein [Chitinophagaceae bacterium]